MSTFNNVIKTCILCMKESEQVELLSTNSFGYSDLDFRPSFMARDTMFAWLDVCPHCGYVANDIFNLSHIEMVKGIDVMQDIVSSEAYRKCDHINFLSDKAENFYRHHLILLKANDVEAAVEALKSAAWVCDDKNDEENAIVCRKKAIRLIDMIVADSCEKSNTNDRNKWYFKIIKNFRKKQINTDDNSSNLEYLDLIRLDMMRRIGEFENVLHEYSTKCYSKEIYNKTLKFHLEKSKVQDALAYTFGDV